MTSPEAMLPSELATPVTLALQTGDWSALQQLMDTGQLTEQQKARVIVEVSKCVNAQELLQHISPYCSSGQFSSAMAQLVSAGCWTEVCKLSQCLGDRQPEWQIDGLSISSRLLSIVAQGRWRELGAVRQGFSPAQKHWALLQACQRATQLDIIENVFPQCAQKDVNSLLQELVSRGLWWAVGSLFSTSWVISETQRRQALEKAAKEATTWEMSDLIIPHCTKDELLSLSKLLLERRLWWAFGDLLKHNMSTFSECLLPACGSTDTDLLMSHLWNEGHLKRAQKLLKITGTQKSHWKIGDTTVWGGLIQLAAEGKWFEFALAAGGPKNPEELAWAVEEMSKKAGKNRITRITTGVCPISQIPSMITNLMKRGCMKDAALLVCRMVSGIMDELGKALASCHTACYLLGKSVEEYMAIARSTIAQNEQEIWSLLEKAFDLKGICELHFQISEVKNTYFILDNCSDFTRREFWFRESAIQLLNKVLFESALNIIAVSLCDQSKDSPLPQSVDHQVQSTVTEILNEIRCVHETLFQDRTLLLCARLKPRAAEENAADPVFALSFIWAVMKSCNTQVPYSSRARLFFAYLTTIPVVPVIQRNALRAVLKAGKWDVLQYSYLSCAGESVRRLLFWAAVKQKQWTLVKQWADHNLPEDQRSWAMKIACEEKQWDVYRHLAEQGPSEDELIHAHHHIVLNAGTKVILDMYKKGTDVVEVKELLTKPPVSKIPEAKDFVYEEAIFQLSKIESQLKSKIACLNSLESAVKEGDWQVVVFMIRQEPTADKVNMALKAAAAAQAWHAVMQLLRLGVEVFDPRSFLLDMMDKGQWGVCRLMMEQGLSPQLLMDVLPQLMELKLWGLVAKVMDCEVDDAVRQQVMNWALHSNEGSVVSKCMLGMKQGLSIQDREALFHRAIIQGVWQALLPLVKEQDDTGRQHRDAAVLHAIREQQWDVVDVCLLHHADINVLDDNGDLPLHRAAQAGDWETVLALAERGGDVSLLDSEGLSVLHRAIQTKRWVIMKLLIGFGCHLQQCARHRTEKRTVIEMLVAGGQSFFITDALSQRRGQWKGTNSAGETALHVVCRFGHHEHIPFLLLQGVDPLLVTHRGHSALSYAVLFQPAQQLTEAKYISLLSAYQPHITHTARQRTGLKVFLSPVLLAVMRGLPLVTRMLYEAGSCSSHELFLLLPYLHEFVDPNTSAASTLAKIFLLELNVFFTGRQMISVFRRVKGLDQESAQYLISASTAPRSLKSCCRLVIADSLQISGTREEDIATLPLPKAMQDYLLFSDLVCPEFDTGDDDDEEEENWEEYEDEEDGWYPEDYYDWG